MLSYVFNQLDKCDVHIIFDQYYVNRLMLIYKLEGSTLLLVHSQTSFDNNYSLSMTPERDTLQDRTETEV